MATIGRLVLRRCLLIFLRLGLETLFRLLTKAFALALI
jgi:hypothetical protein